MKKTLAILLASVLMVCAIFAVTMITGAEEETYTKTVEIILTDGSTIYMGQQPKFGTGAEATTVKSFDSTNVVNIVELGSGKISFDETTGTLTVDSIEARAIRSWGGSLVLVVKGTNNIKNTDGTTYGDDALQVFSGNLTVKGDGTLNVEAANRAVSTGAGNIQFTDAVTVNATATSNDTVVADTTTAKTAKVIVDGSAKVTVASASWGSAIRVSNAWTKENNENCGEGDSGLYVGGTATLTVNTDVTQQVWWTGAVVVRNLEVSGGTFTLNYTANATSIDNSALRIIGGKATFSGGDFVMNHTTAQTTWNTVDVNSIYLRNGADMVVSGGRVKLLLTLNAAVSKFPVIRGTDGTEINVTEGFLYVEPTSVQSLECIGVAGDGGTVKFNVSDGYYYCKADGYLFFNKVTAGITGGDFYLNSPFYGLKDGESTLAMPSGTETNNVGWATNNWGVGDAFAEYTPAAGTMSVTGNTVKTPLETLKNPNATSLAVKGETVQIVNKGTDYTKGAISIKWPVEAVAGNAESVTVTPATGDPVVLDGTNTTFNGTTGTAIFDLAQGTLTVTDLTGVKSIASTTGSLTVIVKGTNVIDNTGANNGLSVNYTEFVDPDADPKVFKAGGNLTIKGDGKLTVTGKEYVVLCQSGLLNVTDKVDLTVNAEKDAMHVSATPAGSGASILFNGECKVTVNTTKGWGVRAGADSSKGHKITVDEKANITVNTTLTNSWQAAMSANEFQMKNGTVDLNVTCAQSGAGKAAVGLNVQNGTAKFVGGTMDIKVENTSNRSYGLFFKSNVENMTPIEFAGTVFNFDISVTDTTDAGRGIISFQNNSGKTAPSANITGGKIAYKGDANTALFNYAGKGIAITMTGGEVEGTAAAFIYNQNVAGTMNVTGGSITHTSTNKNYTGSNTVTQEGDFQLDGEAKEIKYVYVPKTSDNVISVAAIVLSVSAVAVAAAVVLRKRSCKA